jgi:hypothetical protein
LVRALDSLQGRSDERIHRRSFGWWQQFELRSIAGRFDALSFSFSRFASGLTRAPLLHFTHSFAQFFAPFGQRIARNTGKLD